MMAAPGVFDLELQEEDAIECDQSDDDAIEVEEVSNGENCLVFECHVLTPYHPRTVWAPLE